MRIGSDYAVPLQHNRKMIAYYRRRMDECLPGLYVIYGHIGDGHVHVNIMPETQQQYELAHQVVTESPGPPLSSEAQWPPSTESVNARATSSASSTRRPNGRHARD